MSGFYLLVAFDRGFDTAVVEFDSAWLPHVASGTKKERIKIINGSGYPFELEGSRVIPTSFSAELSRVSNAKV